MNLDKSLSNLRKIAYLYLLAMSKKIVDLYKNPL